MDRPTPAGKWENERNCIKIAHVPDDDDVAVNQSSLEKKFCEGMNAQDASKTERSLLCKGFPSRCLRGCCRVQGADWSEIR